jgi:hypothetical protein
MLASLRLTHVGVLGPDDRPEATLPDLEAGSMEDLPPPLLQALRLLAARADGRVVVSGLHHDSAGRRSPSR